MTEKVSFNRAKIRIFPVLHQLPFAPKPMLREDSGTVKKTGISVNQVFL